MSFLRRTHVKIVLLVALLAAVAAVSAKVAFARPAAKIGSGVVIVETNLGYEDGSAAGTGMVLSSGGEVLTNNHVINGATSIKVVVPGAGRTYNAKVVGYSRTRDIAVIQLAGASNLKTITPGSSAKVGQTVTALGNAGGAGTLTTVKGAVVAVGRTITASDETGNAETLTGLIETDAAIQAGDSGGPLYDSARRVLGMDTAASSGNAYQVSESTQGYAIPIAKALAVADLIEAGKASSTVHIGTTAFFGVEVALVDNGWRGETGAAIEAVVQGGPADAAGLVAGDVITALNGKAITSPTQITAFILAQKPGAKVRVAYTDAYGESGTAVVTLGTGPAQ
jgi:S1-C subfamily serine protease